MGISPYYSKQFNCLNCKEKFSSTRIRSRFVRVNAHESDFKPVYSNLDINPLFYNVAVCSCCGFSFTDEFSPYFAPGTKENITMKITTQWNHRDYHSIRTIDKAIETYKLAYLSALYKKEKPLTVAGLTLRIAWLYRDQDLTGEEKRFLTIARNLYTDSYSAGDYSGTQMSELRVLYLIGELSWRIGDREMAVRNFSRVIERQQTSTEPKIIQLAKERWQEIRLKN